MEDFLKIFPFLILFFLYLDKIEHDTKMPAHKITCVRFKDFSVIWMSSADKSNRTRNAQLLSSSATAMSWWTRRRALEWYFLFADWRSSWILITNPNANTFFQYFWYERQVRDRSLIFFFFLSKPCFFQQSIDNCLLETRANKYRFVDVNDMRYKHWAFTSFDYIGFNTALMWM